MIDRIGLAEFLRTRRDLLQPEDVGLPRGSRRRTSGLRREEVAALAHMSVDYYARLERERGPQPSEQMLASIAQGLHLSHAERDHLFRLAGHTPPAQGSESEHVSPGLLRVLDRLDDTPAEIVTEVGETLRQSRMGVALTGDTASLRGPERSLGVRWFTDPGSRSLYAPRDHDFLSRMFASGLREVVTARGPGSRAAALADYVLDRSAEFRTLWAAHEVGLRPKEVKHFTHPEVGELELHCQQLVDPGHAHSLLVYTAIPGSESAEKLRLLSVIGDQTLQGGLTRTQPQG
ncbi:Helix-turn-helix domain-containing protein [Leifsonia sp. 98AMF]|uniref:helix-turn-helix transcriptional regulator n=1 Tax=unclassified Leifsonia TaxID=2663824 RepID=UPI00087AF76D|nr:MULTISPECIES: helix-turn-helix transcriptional regulator [unclassified Leifsonia]SDH56688.1 Helix-turn-helix domain-containing protein [Leifsonia sp. 197AMF]SDI82453.1 Helix-turn-helix domain-containing protein [Leifsonia sp. 466MF]SDK01994.1 Helix-turn-helix domain-containing protein [Leifsonia sp. 157MF]SDN85450.1 Helix-turn-helix domain-containing protein [Leifsonia sp. 509MF]SEN19534.1 Helix-turn-helix domain-containing protein [Leifsonia sp. 467MF]